MEHTVIAYGMDHTDNLLAFAGTDARTLRDAKQIYRFLEHGTEWIARRVNETIILTKTDKYGNHTHVTKFVDRAEFDAWLKENDLKGDYDIENGGAPFGYQRSPRR